MSPGGWVPAAERHLNASRRLGTDLREGFLCLPAGGYRPPGEIFMSRAGEVPAAGRDFVAGTDAYLWLARAVR